jgi:ADP-dependent phosphofructokinase/glucokinase
MSTAVRWMDRYHDLAGALVRDAPASGPYVLGFNVCVDAVWCVDGPLLARLVDLARLDDTTRSSTTAAEQGPRLCRLMVDRIIQGHGGEIAVEWSHGPSWFAGAIRPPDRLQAGGTGAQAAWTLAELGARCIMPLSDRSPTQLGVLHPDIEVAVGDRLTPLRHTAPPPGWERAARPLHHIFEFTAGTPLGDREVPRSTRIIVRFADDGIECDDGFAALQPEFLPTAQAAVVSGMNAIADGDDDSWRWLDGTIEAWSELKVPNVHLELADYGAAADMRTAVEYGAGRALSLGLSLSELRKLNGGAAPSWTAVQSVASRHGYDAVVVHADEWSCAVHRQQPAAVERRLAAGNLLASARAFRGGPTSHLDVPASARIVDDHPRSGDLGDGWHVTCVPSPYLRAPTSTVGLGDSFVAGFQLAAALGYAEGGPPT